MKFHSAFNRIVLPGLAFKAVVIGGGYATGRELVEFFMGAGPLGGLYGMLLATAVWSAVCAATFLFAFRVGAIDYESFFRALLGRFDFLFEIIYFAFLILVLAVFGAAAGEIAVSLFGWPSIVGSLALVLSVLVVCSAGQDAAEAVFKYVSILLYGVYAVFLGLSLWNFGPQIAEAFARAKLESGWAPGGITYASYNVLGAALILPVLRHQQRASDAVISGLLAGPLAMTPAIAFFVSLAAFYPSIMDEPLPSDYVLRALGSPIFHFAFQMMVFAALLECSVGFVQAFISRIDAYNLRRGRQTGRVTRILVPAALTFGSVYFASTIGLVELIAAGYRAMGIAVLVIFILPLLTVGLFRLVRGHASRQDDAEEQVESPG